MVILFADKSTNAEKEISEILRRYGADAKCGITVITDYKKTETDIILPSGAVGICEDSDLAALKILMANGATVITCGMNPKSTVTLSSLTPSSALVSLQRTVTDIFGKNAEPCEFGIKLNRGRSPFAVTASAAVLLLAGITPAQL